MNFFHLGDGFKFEDRAAQHHVGPSHFGHYELPEKLTEQSLSDFQTLNLPKDDIYTLAVFL